MKIAIIAPGFLGATLPLAKHIQKLGHDVTCYYLVESGSKGTESLDFDRQISFFVNIVEIDKDNLLFKTGFLKYREKLLSKLHQI